MTQNTVLSIHASNRVEIPAEAPTRVQILPWGRFESNLSEGGTHETLVDEVAFEAMQNALASLPSELMFDYEHQSEEGGDPQGLSRAAGWVKSIDMEPGVGIFATVKWTPRAEEMIRNLEYRYLSPAGWTRLDDGRWVELTSIALTNRPFLGLKPILNRRKLDPTTNQKRSPNMDEIRKALGLPKDADETACVAAINKAKTNGDRYDALRMTVCGVAGVDAASSSDDDVVKAANELVAKSSGDATGEVAQLRTALKTTNEALATTTSELNTVKNSLAERDAEQRIANAQKAGKLTPAMLTVGDDGSNFYRTLAKNADQWKAWEANAPRVMPVDGKPVENPSSNANTTDRTSVINTARAEFDSKPELESFTSRAAFVKNALRERKMSTDLSDEEKRLVA